MKPKARSDEKKKEPFVSSRLFYFIDKLLSRQECLDHCGKNTKALISRF